MVIVSSKVYSKTNLEGGYFDAEKTSIPGLSFSSNKALGITKVKKQIVKVTGIPITKSGRSAKAGKLSGL